MKRIEIKHLNETYKDLTGTEVQICGWVRTIRDNKTLDLLK